MTDSSIVSDATEIFGGGWVDGVNVGPAPAPINPFDRQVGGNHYKKPGVPDVTEWCMLHGIDLAEFNVIKYVFRHDKKNGMEDLRKAQHYLEFIAWIKYGENL